MDEGVNKTQTEDGTTEKKHDKHKSKQKGWANKYDTIVGRKLMKKTYILEPSVALFLLWGQELINKFKKLMATWKIFKETNHTVQEANC